MTVLRWVGGFEPMSTVGVRSFAGQSLKSAEFEACKPSLDAMQDTLMQYGIAHQDISPNNIQCDEQAKKLMVIEFEGVSVSVLGKRKEIEGGLTLRRCGVFSRPIR